MGIHPGFYVLGQELPTIAWILLALALFAIVLGISYDLWQKAQRRKVKTPWDLFKEVLWGKAITDNEEFLLRDLIRIYRIKNPLDIVKNRRLFSECADRSIEEIQTSQMKPTEKSEAILCFTRVRRKLGFSKIAQDEALYSSREIETGTVLHVEVEADGVKKIYTGTVSDIDDVHITMNTPKERGRMARFKSGLPINIYFWRTHEAIYNFKSRIISQMDRPSQLSFLEHGQSLVRQDRRAYKPVNLNQVTKLVPIPADTFQTILLTRDFQLLERLPKIEALVLNLETAGVSVFVKQAIPVNDYINFEILPPGEETPIGLMAKITARDEVTPNLEYILHGEFVGLSEEKRAEIVRILYEKS